MVLRSFADKLIPVTTDPTNFEGAAFDPTKVDAGLLRRFCVEKGIRRIRVYGSAVRGDFDPARSDVDLLIDFLPIGSIKSRTLRFEDLRLWLVVSFYLLHACNPPCM